MANDKFKATPVTAVDATVPGNIAPEKINSVEFLPKYHQTSTNTKFFNATLDPLLSKGAAEDVNAYVGRRSGTVYNPAKDPYVSEIRKEREEYQLDVGIVSKDANGNISHKMAYADLLSTFQSKIPHFKPDNLDTDYYSWNPPIDIDKFVNFSHYYWFPMGLPPVEIAGNIDIDAEIIGGADCTIGAEYDPNPVLENKKALPLKNGMKLYFTNNSVANSKYLTTTDGERTFHSVDATTLFDVSDLVGNNYSLQIDCTFTTQEDFFGMHTVRRNAFMPEYQKDASGNILHRNWVEVSPGVIQLSFDGILQGIDPSTVQVRVRVINHPIYFIVSGVGQRIQLLDESKTNPRLSYTLGIPEGYDTVKFDMDTWDATTQSIIAPEYIVMQKDAQNNNAWSRVNQWHHISAIVAVFSHLGQTVNFDTIGASRAKRPIIEFLADMEMINHGTSSIDPVDLFSKSVAVTDISGHVRATVDGVEVKDKQRILFSETGVSIYDNRVATVSGVGKSIVLTFSDLLPVCTSVLVKSGSRFANSEWWFSGANIVPAQQKTKRNQLPIFALYDVNGIKLDDASVYKSTNFTGSTVFQYKSGTFSDTELGFGVEYENTSYDVLNNYSPYAKNFANLKFIWTQNASDVFYDNNGTRANIPGTYYVRFNNNGKSEFSNGWTRNATEALTLQRITHIVADTAIDNSIIVPGDVTPRYEYQAYIDNGAVQFDLIGKDGTVKTWNADGSLLFPIGGTATIHNYTGHAFTVYGKNGAVVQPAHASGKIEVTIGSLSENGESPYMSYECSGQTGSIQLVDPFKESRSLQVRQNGKKLNILQDFAIAYNMVDNTYTLSVINIAKSDIIEVLFSSNVHAGVYSTHSTIEANPDNASIQETSFSKMFEHFTSIIASQPMISGSTYGENTWVDSSKQSGTGYVIQQQDNGSLLPGILLAGKIDPIVVLSKAADQYASYRTKVIAKLQQISQQLDVTAISSADLVDKVLAQLNVGKNSTFPHAYSDMVLWESKLQTAYIGDGYETQFAHNASYDPTSLLNDHIYVYVNGTLIVDSYTLTGTNVVFNSVPADTASITIRVYRKSQYSFVPPSLAKLGITEWYLPSMQTDKTINRNYIICHDGTELSAFENAYMNDAILEFENRIYSATSTGATKQLKNTPGYYRQGAYSISDKNAFLNQFYDKWASDNAVNSMDNIGYDAANPFTWNYTSPANTVVGSWKAIYSFLFDTIRPHIAPWEMLGYGTEPTWWSSNYSWTDVTKRLLLEAALRRGIVSEPGKPITIKAEFARPNAVFPVSSTGELLNPIDAKLANRPGSEYAAAPWKFGDHGNQESAWRRSAYFQWAEAVWNYSVSPNKFFGKYFDTFNSVESIDGQIVSKDTHRRPQVSDLVMHRQNGAYKTGLNQLIAEYVISQNRNLDTDFYNLVNNGSVQLMYRVGGYADKRTLRFKADTLKQSASSNFIPEENFNIQLYKGAPFKNVFYSGVKVVWTGNGYEVSGYDRVKNSFTVYLPKNGSRSKAITFSNVNMLDVYDFELTTTEIPYGTVYKTRQEVYNFFAGLNKAMIENGFVFDQYDSTLDLLIDFKLSGKQFMFWSESTWAAGSYIALSPMSDLVKYNHGYGLVDDFTQHADYDPILAIDGARIPVSDLSFDRTSGGVFLASPRNSGTGIFGLAISLVEMEHAVIFDNVTTFGDTIYNPLYRLKQYRLKYVGQKTSDWNGTTYSPGFMLNNDKIIGNFDRTISDISDRYYGVEGHTQNSRLLNTARHSTGMQGTGALPELIDDQNVMFEFSKSMIRQKGTPAAYNKILRNAYVEGATDTLLADEEWMFKMGEFGNVNSIQSWEFRVKQEDFKDSKQLIRFDDNYTFNANGHTYRKMIDSPLDQIIDMPMDDPRWVHKAVDMSTSSLSGQFDLFPTRQATIGEYQNDPINAGYALSNEADFTAVDIDGLKSLHSTLTTQVNGTLPDYRVWVSDYTSQLDGLNTDRFSSQHVPLGWNMLVMQNTGITIETVTPDATSPTAPPTITFTAGHPLKVGDLIMTMGSGVDGIHSVKSVTADSITIDAVASSATSGGTVVQLMPTRFAELTHQQIATDPRYAWKAGQLIYVDSDNGGIETLKVDSAGNNMPDMVSVVSSGQLLTDTGLIHSITLYDRDSNRELIELDIYDPFKGFIPRAADRNIDIKSANDPALYSFSTNAEIEVNENSNWGPDQVGTVWWDMSTSKFLNYEQGSIEYRHSNWGKLFPGATVDVYQWIESTVGPLEYNSASENATPVNGTVPTGSAKVTKIGQESIYSYSSKESVNSDGTISTLYYFWVKGVDTISSARMDKTLSVSGIAAVIQNPTDMGIAWAAPISSSTMIMSGVSQFLNNTSTTAQIQFRQIPDNNMDMAPEVHSQWILLRENDSVTKIPEWLHGKLRDSLAGFDRNTEIHVWANYDANSMYHAGDIFSYDGVFYRVVRAITPDDLNSAFSARPFYKLYDYEILPQDIHGNNRIRIQSRRDVPNYRLDVYDRFGNGGESLQQTWIKDRTTARMTFIASANKLLAGMDLFEMAPAWDKHLRTITKGTHLYDISKFYNVIDFVSPDYNSFAPVSYTYALETDIDMTLNGVYVLVQNSTRYAIYLIANNQRTLMYKKNATIQFTQDLFNSVKQQFSWDLSPWDFTAWDNDPGIEFGEIVTALREDIFTGEYSINYNKLFFDMVRYIFSENDAVDWITKSSYLYIDNLDVDNLSQKPYFVKDTVQQYIDYINEIKPYRTKVRRVIDTRPVADTVAVSVEDSMSPEIEFKYNRVAYSIGPSNILGAERFEEPAVPKQTRYSGGRFGIANPVIVTGGKFGELGEDSGELVPTIIRDALVIEVVSKYDGETYAFRMNVGSDGVQRYTRLSRKDTTKLAETLLPDDTEIILMDGTMIPDPIEKSYVFINGERIQYQSKDGNTLSELIRGFGIGEYPAGLDVIADTDSTTLENPLNGCIAFNDLGKTLKDSMNSNALLILQDQGD